MRWNKPSQAWLLALALLAPATTAAQFDHTTHHARHSAMGGVSLYDLDHRSTTLSYRANYMLGALASKDISLVWPTGSSGTAVASYRHHGNLDYHEQQLAGGYVIRATQWLLVGAKIRYLNLGTSDSRYQPQQWLGASLLLHAQPWGNTLLALEAGTRPWDPQRPYRWHLAAGYRPLSQLLTIIEAESEERMRLRFGMEYSYHELLHVRTGFSTHPLVLTFGLGTQWRQMAIDLAVEVHDVLGITPHTSLTLWF